MNEFNHLVPTLLRALAHSTFTDALTKMGCEVFWQPTKLSSAE